MLNKTWFVNTILNLHFFVNRKVHLFFFLGRFPLNMMVMAVCCRLRMLEKPIESWKKYDKNIVQSKDVYQGKYCRSARKYFSIFLSRLRGSVIRWCTGSKQRSGCSEGTHALRRKHKLMTLQPESLIDDFEKMPMLNLNGDKCRIWFNFFRGGF